MSEQWETKLPSLIAKIKKLKSEEPIIIKSVKSEKSEIEEDKRKNSEEDILPYYESIQNTGKCRAIRREILTENIAAVQDSRRSGMLRCFWPFSGIRLNEQFILPRMGLVFPPLIMPEIRYKLFPSRGRKRYKVSEIYSWYDKEKLNEDDMMLMLSQTKGEKRRAYEIWLTHEQDRVEEARIMFLNEDITGHRIASHWNNVENIINTFHTADPSRRAFSLLNYPLPGDYDFIKKETQMYPFGSGEILTFMFMCVYVCLRYLSYSYVFVLSCFVLLSICLNFGSTFNNFLLKKTKKFHFLFFMLFLIFVN